MHTNDSSKSVCEEYRRCDWYESIFLGSTQQLPHSVLAMVPDIREILIQLVKDTEASWWKENSLFNGTGYKRNLDSVGERYRSFMVKGKFTFQWQRKKARCVWKIVIRRVHALNNVILHTPLAVSLQCKLRFNSPFYWVFIEVIASPLPTLPPLAITNIIKARALS